MENGLNGEGEENRGKEEQPDKLVVPEKPAKKIRITYEEYRTIANLLILHLRQVETSEEGLLHCVTCYTVTVLHCYIVLHCVCYTYIVLHCVSLLLHCVTLLHCYMLHCYCYTVLHCYMLHCYCYIVLHCVTLLHVTLLHCVTCYTVTLCYTVLNWHCNQLPVNLCV